MAEQERVEIRYYNVIYKAIEEIREAMAGLLDSIFKEHITGRAEVREVFRVPKLGAVAGCLVQDGKISRGGMVRLVRDGVVVYEGKIGSLRRFKDDVKEVASGYECGIRAGELQRHQGRGRAGGIRDGRDPARPG